MWVRYYASEGIVLRTYDLGEADRIVVFLSPGEGSIRAVAKGVRRPQSKLAALVQVFTQGQYQFYRGRQLDTVTQGELVCAHRRLRSCLDRMAAAAYVVELAGEVARERQDAPELYRLVSVTLATLAESPLQLLEIILRRFELALLAAAGYAPELRGCVHCGTEQPPFVFSARDGGIVCLKCDCSGTGRRLSPANLAQLRVLDQLAFSRLGVLRLLEGAQQELAGLLQEFIQVSLDFRPRTLEALAEIRNMQRGDDDEYRT